MTFPNDVLPVVVELAEIVSPGVWTDITADVRTEAGIIISRGRADEAGQTAPQTCSLTIDNALGKYTARNPAGPYYGRLGRNTLLRVKVGSSVRFLGEVAEWPPRWDASERNNWVPLTVSGIMRRLGQGSPPLVQGLRSFVIAEDPNNYWPLDEGELAGFGRNASTNSSYPFYPWPTGGPARPVFKFGAGELEYNLPNGLQITRTNAGGASYPYMRGDIALTGSELTVDFVFRHGTNPAQLTLAINDYNDNIWQLTLRAGAFNDVQMAHELRSTGATTGLSDSSALSAMTDGRTHHVRLSLAQDGADVDYNVFVDGEAVLGGTAASLVMNGCAFLTFRYPLVSGTETPVTLAHVAVWEVASSTAPDAYSAMTGYAGETAAERMDRVLGEAGIGFTLVGSLADSVPMGSQVDGDVLAQLRDAAAADMGSLYEPRDTLGIAYRTREATYNQAASVTINYAAHELMPPLEPTDDDQLTRNDITVKRTGGGSARAVLTSGRLSTQAPPAGVGPYQDEVTVNVAGDGQLSDVAGHKLLHGTWDENRYPVITVERASPPVVANPTLDAALLAVEVDDMLALVGLGGRGIPDDVFLIVRGYTETLAPYLHTFEFACTPAGPYRTGVWANDVDTTGSRYSPGGIRTWEGLTTTETALEVLIDDGGLFGDDDVPFDIVIGGERMTVTAVDPTTQQFVANGTGDSQNNLPVTPGFPPGTSFGDLVLIFASIRNSGTGTPDQPASWVTLADFGNVKLFARHYDGVWTMPTVTFTGGAAGQDTIAQACSFRGVSIGAFATTQLNASQQDIPLPFFGGTGGGVPAGARLILWLGWKQDDWTSVANLPYAGAVEINERVGTALDAAQVWAYKLVTDPHESIPSLFFDVAGGAAAISRGLVVMLWPGQTLTVTRSVNGVQKAHSSGQPVELWQAARYAL